MKNPFTVAAFLEHSVLEERPADPEAGEARFLCHTLDSTAYGPHNRVRIVLTRIRLATLTCHADRALAASHGVEHKHSAMSVPAMTVTAMSVLATSMPSMTAATACLRDKQAM